MASRIEQIIEEIEEYIDGCKYQALSSSKITPFIYPAAVFFLFNTGRHISFNEES